jgi:hypothetical protein
MSSQFSRLFVIYLASLFAAALCAYSVLHLYRSLTPPYEVYDNEKMMLAFVYGTAAIPFVVTSLLLCRPVFRQLPMPLRVLMLLVAGYVVVGISFSLAQLVSSLAAPN